VITIKYQVFFFDPAQNRENQLQAIQPIFHTPSAIKVLMKTAKFEDKQMFVFSGLEEDLLQFVQKVERLDVTDWLDKDGDGIAVEMDKLSENFKVSRFELNNNPEYDDEQVLGDPPEDEVTAAKKRKGRYPADVPERSKDIWDNITKSYSRVINKSCGKDKDKKLAGQRILYYQAARRLGIVPYSKMSDQLNIDKSKMIDDIESGEKKASKTISRWERHLKSDGTLKRAKAIKYLCSEFENTTSRYYIAHAIEWILNTD